MNVAQGFQKASARHEFRSRTRGRPLAIAAGLLLALTGCSDDSPALDVSESELVTGTLPDVVITSLAYAGGKFTCTIGPNPIG